MKNRDQNYSIQPAHNILNVRLRGTWDPEVTRNYCAQYKRKVSCYFAREWACILDLQGLDLLIDEDYQVVTLKALHTWSYIKGMQALAVVVSGSNRNHLLYQFEDILRDNQPHNKAVFNSVVEADQWLHELGFHHTSERVSQKTA